MCYVLAKNFNKHGCIALKSEIGKELADFVKTLNELTKDREIQIVTISRPQAYGEYAPYSFVNTKEELIKAVTQM